MRLLLDTHVLLWWLDDAPNLLPTVREAIAEPRNRVYVSAVSGWEIVVKRSLGKLDIPEDWAAVLLEEPFLRLPITWEHAIEVSRLPDLHRDPFDRLLLGQAQKEDLVLVTHDEAILQYPVRTLRT